MTERLHSTSWHPPPNPSVRGVLQRKCACGGTPGPTGECAECRRKRTLGMTSRFATPVQTALSGTIHRMVLRQETPETPPEPEPLDFETLTAEDLKKPEITARIDALPLGELLDARSVAQDAEVQKYLDALIAKRPDEACSQADIQATNNFAEEARKAALPFVQLARTALDRLHMAWINNKADLLAGTRQLRGEVVCAFNSNFNITQRDQNYGVRQIDLMMRLKHLETKMSNTVAYSCQSLKDPECSGKNLDTVAYVRSSQPPIHFCRQFRNSFDSLFRQSVVTHEFAHFLPGVLDQGGYAFGGLGAQVMTCSVNAKFKAKSEDLVHTADAITGFVMHIGQKNVADVQVR
jgi:hypothetical protein